MATTGSVQTNTSFGNVKLSWETTSQDIANNTSTISYSLSIYRSSNISSSASKSYSITINGVKVASGTTTIGGSGTKTIKTGSLKISHNSDGTKTFNLSFSLEVAITWSGSYIGTVTGSGSGTLNTIPRTTTPTLSSKTTAMDSSVTINTPRASSSFTHTLTYSFNGQTGTIASGVTTSYSWKIPLSLANKIPNDTSGSGTITCKTYNGSTLIGTKSVSFIATVPSSVKPSISSVTVADTNSSYAAQFGSLVQNKSKAKFTITASGSYSSTIKSYKTTIESKSYSGATPTTAILSKSGTASATITVTDSRGRTATATKTFNVIAYSSPKITTFLAQRSNADGTENSEGTNAKIDINYSIASANSKNTSSYKIEYKTQSSSTWITLANGTDLSLNTSIVSGSLFDGNSAYDIRLTLTDFFGSIYKTIELSTAFTLLDFNASGKGIAFGKVSEKTEGIEFALPTFFEHAETPSSMKFLDQGQDLNNVTEAGFYAIPNTTVSGSLINKPYSGTATGSLIVMIEGNTNQRVQILHKGSKTDGAIYERCMYQGTWGDWHTVYNGGSKILWSGGYYMTEGHSITLSEPVSKQTNGIVLVFSRYADGAAQNYGFVSHFVPRAFVTEVGAYGMDFLLCSSSKFGVMASKYLYVNDDKIVGHADNSASGTANGITYNNAGFVLRYVIGV